MNKKKIFLVIGVPGSGKTSVCSYISTSKLSHYSIGKMYRDIAKKDTPLGYCVKKNIEIGQIVPIDIAQKVIRDVLKSACEAIIIDGFPRNIQQAIMFDNLIKECNCVFTMLIEIRVDDDEAFKRISNRNRGIDDREELFNDRLDLFKKGRAKIIEHYSKQNKYNNIDGNLDVQTVASNLYKIILSKYQDT